MSHIQVIGNGKGREVNSNQFERWLKKQGIVIINRKGTGHKTARNPATDQETTLPAHGGKKQLPTWLMEQIKKDLGLK